MLMCSENKTIHSFRFYEKYGIRKQNLYVPKGTQKVENSRTKSGTTISAHISQALQLRETKTSGQDRIQKFFYPFYINFPQVSL